MNRSIPSSVPELKESAVPSGAIHIGRDAEGADHYLVEHEFVRIVRHTEGGDELEHFESLETRSVQDWMDYVRDRRGWLVEKYDDRPMLEWVLDRTAPQEQGVGA